MVFVELDGFCNVVFHCFDNEIVLEGMKEEISQQRCTIGAHWYTNNLPENRASKTNVDVVDKKVNSETKLSTREGCVTSWTSYQLSRRCASNS